MLLGQQALAAGSGGAAITGMALQFDGSTSFGEISSVWTAGEVTAGACPACSMGSSFVRDTSAVPDLMCNSVVIFTEPIAGFGQFSGNMYGVGRAGGAAAQIRNFAPAATGAVAHYSISAAASTRPTTYLDGSSVSSSTQNFNSSGTVGTGIRVGAKNTAYSQGKLWATWFCRVELSAGQQTAIEALIDAGDVEGTRDYLLAIDATTSGLWWPTSDTVVADGVIDLCGNYGNMALTGMTGASLIAIPAAAPAQLALDGTNEYVNMGALFTGMLGGGDTADAFSTGIAATMTITGADRNRLIGGATFDALGYLIVETDGRVFFGAQSATNVGKGVRSASGSVVNATEARLGGVHDGTTGYPTVYKNGVDTTATTTTYTSLTPDDTDPVWLGAGSTFAEPVTLRMFWWIPVALTPTQMAALDALLAADDFTGASSYLLAIDAGAVFLPFLTSDDGTGTTGSIEDIAGSSNGTPMNTEAGDLTAV